MFKYQKGSWEIEAFSIMLLLLIIAIWFTVRTLTMHNELNEALTNSGIMCKPTKVNGTVLKELLLRVMMVLRNIRLEK